MKTTRETVQHQIDTVGLSKEDIRKLVQAEIDKHGIAMVDWTKFCTFLYWDGHNQGVDDSEILEEIAEQRGRDIAVDYIQRNIPVSGVENKLNLTAFSRVCKEARKGDTPVSGETK